ncbi:glycine cleavage system aminomethyltransferase GcvT [Eisenibacter elegans]|uniref:glycine cleavage system aminomethyltransferase GcvT n=1 Tax=Eisenibacter elegans TaxID=997 RepID=UPI00041B18A6|nr:glycine cleavage system aminomethyltransferase GcvT [Eisenibacter elegans]
MTNNIKTIALDRLHAEELGAKMVEFAGFSMPVRYSSDKEEHLAVRQGVGVFDVSHMGEFMVRGPQALDLIQYVVSNDAAKLYDGKVMYCYLPNDKGGIVDDLLVYRMGSEEYLLVVNAGNIDKDWQWINQHNTFDAKLENISENTSLFAVQGPKAIEAMQSLTEVRLADMEYYTFQKATFAGVPDVIISATGYTGAGGFELYVPNAQAEKVWRTVFEAGKDFNIQPIGLGARDTLRLEKGFCLYGNDIDDTTSPIEAGLGWVTKFTKDFINSQALKAQKEQGVAQKLVGFKMVDKAIPRGGYEIVDAQGTVIGRVTSGTMSPLLNIGIGMGYVPAELAKPDTTIHIRVRNKDYQAVVTKLPFV